MTDQAAASGPAPEDAQGNVFLVYAVAGDRPGEIVRAGTTSDVRSLPDQVGEGEDWLPQQADDRFYFVADGAVTERPPWPLPESLALAIGETATIEVGAAAVVRLDGGKRIVATDGTIEFDFDEPGKHRIEVRPPWPYREAAIVVIVT
ncbi:MAG: hypothetical protein VW338_00885 [Rhodospirillaceae bacterium]